MRNITVVPAPVPETKFNGKAIANASAHYQTMNRFVQGYMRQGIDYGTVPGIQKPILMKAGAEKLCKLFKLRPTFELIQSVVDFDNAIFHYHNRCSLYRNGELVAQSDGCCNSKEKVYAKQAYKVYDLVNTITKMSQKRVLVAAVLVSCSASQFFTQDLEA